MPRCFSLLSAAVLLALWSAVPVSALADSYLADYESGQRALRYSSWDEAVFWFKRAADKHPQDDGPPARLSGRNYVAYLPHYYLGLALFQGGRYSEALKTWDAAETQWRSEQWLAGSKGLLEYRESISAYRARYETELLPGAIRGLNTYLGNVQSLLARVKQLTAPHVTPEIHSDIADVESRLPEWTARSAAARDDYGEVVALTREIVQALDRLEVLEACAGSDAAQPWCQPQGSGSVPGSQRGYSLPLAAGRAPALARLDPGTAHSLYRLAAAAAGDASQGLFVRPQDVSAIRGLYNKKYALLISPTYSRWEAITSAAPKLNQFQGLLRQLGFEVTVLAKPLSKKEIQDSILEFFERAAPVAAGRPNLLLVHFIGHGYTFDNSGERFGVLVTSTAPGPKADAASIAQQSVFESFFKQFVSWPRHHIVFTFETCSSGRFLDELEGPNPKDWRKCIGNPAFLVLTAGDVDEVGSLKQLPLTDELIRAFGGCGQHGKEVIWSGYLILQGVRDKIMTQFRNRNPQFKKYIFEQHRDGDFVLAIPDRCVAAKNV